MKANGKTSLVSQAFAHLSISPRKDTQILEFPLRIPEPGAEPEANHEEVVEDAVVVDSHSHLDETEVSLAETEADKPATGAAAGTTGAFHFMLESELEPQPPVASEDAEVPGDIPQEPVVNGMAEEPSHVQHSVSHILLLVGILYDIFLQMDDPLTVPQADGLDWAADDGGGELPPINTLEAKFGTSGNVTPEVQPELEEQAPASLVEKAPEAQHHHHGRKPHTQPGHEGDGFTTISSRRGGGERGGFRGGERGGRGRGGYNRGTLTISKCSTDSTEI